jgi:heterodisulfide reductase subunit A
MSNGLPRTGVFVCDCGLNIAGTVNTRAVTDFAETLPGVTCAVLNRYTCADPGQNEIRRAITEHKLERVVVASCTPRIHESTFRACVESAGMNPYLLEMANLREHCSWVHVNEPEAATEKAKDLVASAVARAQRLRPQIEPTIKVTQSVLVIGGGIAGIQAALDMADGGLPVYLVEKEPSIGGIMAQLDKTYPTMDCSI